MKTVEEKALNEIEKQQNEASIAFLGTIQLEVPEFNAVKNALEKQIPKKGTIKYLSSYTDDPPVLLCPNCQEHIPTEGCNFYKYCYKCGQSLDWSDHPTEKGGSEE